MKLEAELRAIGVQFDPAATEYEKKKLIEEWWIDNMNIFCDIEQPATAKRQRTDAGGISGELIQRLASESAFPLHVVLDIASWSVAKMKEILHVLKTPFSSKAK